MIGANTAYKAEVVLYIAHQPFDLGRHKHPLLSVRQVAREGLSQRNRRYSAIASLDRLAANERSF